MDTSKDQIVAAIANNAHQRLGELADEFVRARSQEREFILAEMDYRNWLVGVCLISLDRG